MPAFGTRRVHSTVKFLCWHLLLLVFSFITCCISAVSSLKLFLSSRTLDKLPRHLALLVDSQDAVPHLSKLVQLLERLAHLGLKHISVYDAKGTLKLVLADALKGNPAVQIYCHNYAGGGFENQRVKSTNRRHCGKHDTGSVSPCENKSHLLVEVLCIRDGKQAIVEAARNICLKSLQPGIFSNLKEEDLDTSLKETGGFGPDPDLLLLFSDSRCLQGFPPWRLRLTEIQHVGSIKDMSKRTIFRALDEFSHKQHRYGK